MQKFGTPEKIERVREPEESGSDDQGINVTAARREAETIDFHGVDLVNEREDND